MNKWYVGVDNGVSGSIGVISDEEVVYFKVPVRKYFSYTKKKQFIHRLDFEKLCSFFSGLRDKNVFVLIERPLVNPMKFVASMSAMRAFESLVICLEINKISFNYIDSKKWQHTLLPDGCKGKELKTASKQIGQRLFPKVNLDTFEDADGLLIAEYARRLDSTGGLVKEEEE